MKDGFRVYIVRRGGLFFNCGLTLIFIRSFEFQVIKRYFPFFEVYSHAARVQTVHAEELRLTFEKEERLY